MLYDSPIWKFKTFIKESGKNAFDGWYEKLPSTARAAIREKLRLLSITEEWEKGVDYKKIKGAREPIFELRITDKIGKIEYRLFGCFEPGRKNFTILIGATHKMRTYDPPDCLNTAEGRYKSFMKNKEKIDDYHW